jgi:hypothetical protein
MEIDFRLEIDPWCKHDPPILACDGTHIGVQIKQMVLDPPITKADKEGDKVPQHHKR